jgi:DNA-binding MarR family transcriptional regulator
MRSLHRLEGPAWFALDLSMAQFKVLMLIASTGGMTGRDLAQRLDIGPSAVTPLVDKLVQQGYAYREEDRDDRRVTWARPTPAGLAVFERVSSAGREKFEALLAELSPEEAALIERALEILRRAAEQRLSQGASTR